MEKDSTNKRMHSEEIDLEQYEKNLKDISFPQTKEKKIAIVVKTKLL